MTDNPGQTRGRPRPAQTARHPVTPAKTRTRPHLPSHAKSQTGRTLGRHPPETRSAGAATPQPRNREEQKEKGQKRKSNSPNRTQEEGERRGTAPEKDRKSHQGPQSPAPRQSAARAPPQQSRAAQRATLPNGHAPAPTGQKKGAGEASGRPHAGRPFKTGAGSGPTPHTRGPAAALPGAFNKKAAARRGPQAAPGPFALLTAQEQTRPREGTPGADPDQSVGGASPRPATKAGRGTAPTPANGATDAAAGTSRAHRGTCMSPGAWSTATGTQPGGVLPSPRDRHQHRGNGHVALRTLR